MGTAVVQLIPVALGFALSPIPLVEMVLVLFSRRALTNGLVFLACIMLPVFVIPFLGAAGQDAAATTASERSTTQGVILIVVAAALLVIAWRNFRARHSTSVPKVFGKIEGMGPLAVMLLSAGVTIANPKNLVILLGAGSSPASRGSRPPSSRSRSSSSPSSRPRPSSSWWDTSPSGAPRRHGTWTGGGSGCCATTT